MRLLPTVLLLSLGACVRAGVHVLDTQQILDHYYSTRHGRSELQSVAHKISTVSRIIPALHSALPYLARYEMSDTSVFKVKPWTPSFYLVQQTENILDALHDGPLKAPREFNLGQRRELARKAVEMGSRELIKDVFLATFNAAAALFVSFASKEVRPAGCVTADSVLGYLDVWSGEIKRYAHGFSEPKPKERRKGLGGFNLNFWQKAKETVARGSQPKENVSNKPISSESLVTELQQSMHIIQMAQIERANVETALAWEVHQGILSLARDLNPQKHPHHLQCKVPTYRPRRLSNIIKRRLQSPFFAGESYLQDRRANLINRLLKALEQAGAVGVSLLQHQPIGRDRKLGKFKLMAASLLDRLELVVVEALLWLNLENGSEYRFAAPKTRQTSLYQNYWEGRERRFLLPNLLQRFQRNA